MPTATLSRNGIMRIRSKSDGSAAMDASSQRCASSYLPPRYSHQPSNSAYTESAGASAVNSSSSVRNVRIWPSPSRSGPTNRMRWRRRVEVARREAVGDGLHQIARRLEPLGGPSVELGEPVGQVRRASSDNRSWKRWWYRNHSPVLSSRTTSWLAPAISSNHDAPSSSR